jgi:hypothetical protein
MSPSALEAAMARFSDRLVSANKLIIAAAVIYAAGAVSLAHADTMLDDARRHTQELNNICSAIKAYGPLSINVHVAMEVAIDDKACPEWNIRNISCD